MPSFREAQALDRVAALEAEVAALKAARDAAERQLAEEAAKVAELTAALKAAKKQARA